MKLIDKIDREKAFQLTTGIIGIWSSFILCGVLLEYITTKPFVNILSGKSQKYVSAAGLILSRIPGASLAALQKFIIWITSLTWNKFTIPDQNQIKFQMKNIEIAGFLNFISSFTIVASLKYVSFPIFNIFRSISVLFTILVGVLCTKLIKKQFKLQPDKIVVGIFITIGIIIYVCFDPQSQQKVQNEDKSQLIGYLLLVGSILADGFYADYQAKIKEQYNPQPTEMVQNINKWSALVAFFYAIIIGQMIPTVQFSILHPFQLLIIIIYAIPCFIGLVFIYRLIKAFKQHVAPIVATTRRMFTVIISLIFFNHRTSVPQILGIVLVFSASLFEFLISIIKDNDNQTSTVVKQLPNNFLIENQPLQIKEQKI